MTLAVTRRVGRRSLLFVRCESFEEYFESGRLRNRSASRGRRIPLSSLRLTFAARAARNFLIFLGVSAHCRTTLRRVVADPWF